MRSVNFQIRRAAIDRGSNDESTVLTASAGGRAGCWRRSGLCDSSRDKWPPDIGFSVCEPSRSRYLKLRNISTPLTDPEDHGGRVTCYRAKTGELLYEHERLDADGEYWASPIAANDKIYFASARGTISVIDAANAVKVLARNKLGERLAATPAIADDKLYVRTATHLWAFGNLQSR